MLVLAPNLAGCGSASAPLQSFSFWDQMKGCLQSSLRVKGIKAQTEPRNAVNLRCGACHLLLRSPDKRNLVAQYSNRARRAIIANGNTIYHTPFISGQPSAFHQKKYVTTIFKFEVRFLNSPCIRQKIQ